jgi:alpha-tubulin suppressor-like RCC1 family protein
MAHSCAIADGGALLCWGRGHSGQLGTSRMVDTPTPVEVTLAGAASSVAAGDAHTCVAFTDGSAACWGANADGQLGDGTTTDRSMPMPVAPPAGMASVTFDAVTAGAGHTCAHLATNDLVCWGRNADGQLGDGDQKPSALPVPVMLGGKELTPAARVAAGGAHSCGLDTSGNVWCWGSNASGQVSSGDTNDVVVPTSMRRFQDAIDVAAGGAHTCLVAPLEPQPTSSSLQNHLVFCWGANDQGQLGTDQRNDQPVAGLTNVTRVAAGAAHSCAIRRDGTVWCWGSNTSGQLGDGDALVQTTPQLSRLDCR